MLDELSKLRTDAETAIATAPDAAGLEGLRVRLLGRKSELTAILRGIGELAEAERGPVGAAANEAREAIEAALETRRAALEGGELVCLLPQGTIPRGRKFYDPVLKGKSGAARLAAMTGAPVIPFGLWGTEKVWPRSSPVPRLLNLTDPPTVRVRVGPPVELKRRSAAADTRRIMAAIVECLPPEAREVREPTEEEIRLATPGG